jgi:hypothetical protein
MSVFVILVILLVIFIADLINFLQNTHLYSIAEQKEENTVGRHQHYNTK